MTEFKTKEDYEKFLKGNEIFISKKHENGRFELFVCKYCLSHFDDQLESAMHMATCDNRPDTSNTKLGIRELVDN